MDLLNVTEYFLLLKIPSRSLVLALNAQLFKFVQLFSVLFHTLDTDKSIAASYFFHFIYFNQHLPLLILYCQELLWHCNKLFRDIKIRSTITSGPLNSKSSACGAFHRRRPLIYRNSLTKRMRFLICLVIGWLQFLNQYVHVGQAAEVTLNPCQVQGHRQLSRHC